VARESATVVPILEGQPNWILKIRYNWRYVLRSEEVARFDVKNIFIYIK
jgi:hypothetical protein